MMPLDSSTFPSLQDAILSAAALVALWALSRNRASKPPYPPGPTPLPIIGNLFSMPQTRFVLTWSKFGKKYGPLTWLRIPGQDFLVINTWEAVDDLMEKRALTFINRPVFPMLKGLIGLGEYIAVTDYTPNWKKQRAYLKQSLSAAVIRSSYASLLETKAKQYVERCTARPEDFLVEINRVVVEAVITLTYGCLEDDRGTDYIAVNTHILDILVNASQGYVVDMVPALQYLPAWLPGMKFKRDAAVWRREILELEETVHSSARESLNSENPEVQSSFMFRNLQELYRMQDEGQDAQQLAEDELALARAGLIFFWAGTETTQKTLETFVLAMTRYPSVQKKAQDEIERVVGSTRFPSLEDQSQLPYLHAVLLETLRWNPVASSAIPHTSRQDEIYNGYFIPKGTTVVANIWGLTRDPKYYPNPSVFDPERHLQEVPELDPREYVFGFGRRACPGNELALHQVFNLMATILWAFELVGPDASAHPAKDEELFTFGTSSRPEPFKCQYIPRRENIK